MLLEYQLYPVRYGLDFQNPSVFCGTVHRVLLANQAPARTPGAGSPVARAVQVGALSEAPPVTGRFARAALGQLIPLKGVM